ncbi:hypothetical protein ADIS_2300 [Lunatimonas lonarensis]|uniref:Uncharacterized protein n=1 Tax=Lunatimonas lonarensis TaxID=1232681 RepID=R7ZSV6_9BACT|nr:hypothetical protein ADIS_2300 [Lunatimonas lonarensis]
MYFAFKNKNSMVPKILKIVTIPNLRLEYFYPEIRENSV